MERNDEEEIRNEVRSMMLNGVHSSATGSDGETLTASGARRGKDYIELSEQRD